MIITFAIINLILCCLGIATAVQSLRSGKRALLPVYLIVYILTNGLGISFVFIVDFRLLSWQAMVSRFGDNRAYVTLCLTSWIFIVIAALFVRRIARSKQPAGGLQLPSDVALGLSIALLAAGQLLNAKFMFFGPGLRSALATSFFQYDFTSAYDIREEFTLLLESGQGLLMATVASFAILPLSSFFAVLSKKSGATVLVIGGINFASSMLFSFALRQKAPVLLMLLLYGLLYLHFARRATLTALVTKFSDIRILALGAVFLFAGLSYFYHITEGETAMESFAHSLFRFFIIPVVASQGWILAFPDLLPFRGLIGIFDTIFFSTSGAASVHDVSEAITGYRFSMNVTMVSVAWSGAGYLGVFAISAIFCSTAYIIDKFLQRLHSSVFFPLCILSLPSLLALTSTSFLDFIAKGGFITQLTIIFACFVLGSAPAPALLRAGLLQRRSKATVARS